MAISNLSQRCACQVQKHIYYNSNIIYSSFYSNGSSSFVIFTINESDPSIAPVKTFDKDYNWCAALTVDTYGQFTVANCNGYILVLPTTPPFYEIINITLMNTAHEVVIISNTVITKLSTGILSQYSLIDGSLMDIIPFYVNPPNYLRRVGDNQVYIFNASYGMLYNISLDRRCFTQCNCSLPYVQQGDLCVIPISGQNSSASSNTAMDSTSMSQATAVNGAVTQCSENYVLTQQGNCDLSYNMKIVSFIYAIMSTFRIQSAQQVFFLFGNMDLYKYHKTNYTGFFEEFLGYSDIIQDNIWYILKIEDVH